MNSIWRDIRHGARMMIKSPGFTFVAVITLAIGIGAVSSIFSLTNALLIQPLPFPDLNRIVMLREILPNQGLKATAVSPADFSDFRAQNTVFQEIAAYNVRDVTLTGISSPELIRGSFVSANFFSTLGAGISKGRTFLQEENQPGKDRIVVLGYGLWQRRYAADEKIIGKTIFVNGRSSIVAGVMHPSFDFPFGSEIWMPLALTPVEISKRDIRNIYVIARLKSGISVAQAQAEMQTIAERIERQYPQTNTGVSVQVIPLRDQQGDFSRPLLSILFSMAGFLLLLACGNVANLLFARATIRKKELAIRAALGAGRWQLVRQLIIESLLLSCLAGMIGLLLALFGVEMIKASLPPDVAAFMTGWKEIGIDGSVLVFTLVIAFLTTLIFSLVPAMRASRPNLNESLKDGSQFSGEHPLGRARSILIITEVALALVLLTGAGMTVKGFWRILRVFDSADPGKVLVVQTPLPETKYDKPESIVGFYQQAIERMQTLPGVDSVSLSSNTPLNNSPNPVVELNLEGRPTLQPGKRKNSDLMIISPEYFGTVGGQLVKGRNFRQSDNMHNPSVALISQTAARLYWPNEDPIGKRIKHNRLPDDASWITIVGIVGDLKQGWFDKEIRPQIYQPYQQLPKLKMYFLLRTSGDPLALASAARSKITSVDHDQPVEMIKTLEDLFIDEMSPFRFAAVLMLVFGAIALVLSAVGVYGVMSYSVTQRIHEIGIRMALGAHTMDVLKLIHGQGLRASCAGLFIGLLFSWGLGRVMASTLFGVVAMEYMVIAGLVALLGIVSVLSSHIPAHRASKLDPMIALRSE